MIGLKLINEVMKFDIVGVRLSGDFIMYGAMGYDDEKGINIYELAHQCKEWASSNGYALYTGKNDDIWLVVTEETFIGKPTGKLIVLPEFTADTEPEAIFEACEWILRQKGE